jgi:hypothetical protein
MINTSVSWSAFGVIRSAENDTSPKSGRRPHAVRASANPSAPRTSVNFTFFVSQMVVQFCKIILLVIEILPLGDFFEDADSRRSTLICDRCIPSWSIRADQRPVDVGASVPQIDGL